MPMGELTQKIAMRSMQERGGVGAAALDFLMLFRLRALAFYWLKMAVAAQGERWNAGTPMRTSYKPSWLARKFYFSVAPRARAPHG